MFTCHDGWHVVGKPADPTYVRLAVRLRDEQGTYLYRVGSRPESAACTTIWCYGDRGVPWTCIACGRAVVAHTT